MGLKGLFLAFLVIGIATSLFLYVTKCCHYPEVPKVTSGWWGKGNGKNYKEDESIRKFTINVPDKVVQELKTQLKSTIYPEPLEQANFNYGFNTDFLKKVVDYWSNKYDWKKEEARINTFNHFKTQIEGLDIHFLHAKPKSVPAGVRVFPLIMVHGWPGSFVEFLDIIPLLTTPRKDTDFVFEVICPSIPGYGFSEASHQKGFGQVESAIVFDKLMQRLGHKHYFAQGGDWGSLVTSNMAVLFPERVKGLHVNMVFMRSPMVNLKWLVGTYLPSLVVDSKDYSKLYPLGEKLMFILLESGYMHIQATKPDTVGLGLANSPAALAAYILEKFSTWTVGPSGHDHPDGLLTQKFTLDQLLTNVMIYYVTGTITSSVRYYKEQYSAVQQAYQMDRIPVKVPAGVAMFPNELIRMPEDFARHKFHKLVSYTDMPRGGHFAAFEEPKLLADDIWQFVTKVENLPKLPEDSRKN